MKESQNQSWVIILHNQVVCHPEFISGSGFMSYYIYILSNIKRTVYYIGVTNNLKRRIYEHRNGLIDNFSKKYLLKHIVHFEEYQKIEDAISREKQLKNWKRIWKINLIKTKNPYLKDLSKNW